jgi:hypothetical protein
LTQTELVSQFFRWPVQAAQSAEAVPPEQPHW